VEVDFDDQAAAFDNINTPQELAQGRKGNWSG
jgi:molybdopterin-guanine dinucleotide biosynthesis protein A